jgi:hypothetical protein
MFMISFGYRTRAPSCYMVDSALAWKFFWDAVIRGDSVNVCAAESSRSRALPYVAFHHKTGIVWGSR